MREQGATRDLELAKLAAEQHGVVSVAQLHGIGLDKSAISRRLGRGRLHRLHRGVYAVGHRGVSRQGRWMAAVLAYGEGAVLSHGDAAALWGLLRPLEGPVHVSIPTQRGARSPSGIRIHRCRSLVDRSLVSRREGVPVTTVPRTIADLRSTMPPRLVRRATRQAELAGHRFESLEGDRTRSELEVAFLALCRRARLPAPEVNVRLGRWEVDFLWRVQRLVVEVDGFAYHRGSVAFENDHARDLDLRGHGYALRRFTGRQIEREPRRIAAHLRPFLRPDRGRSEV